MANNDNQTPVGDPAQPKIVWDDEGMKSSYANVCNVASTREEVLLFFGLNQSWHGGAQEVKVKLTDRIILSPLAAKRLMALLGRVLRDYDSRFGATEQPAAAESKTK
jgi:hypothetical protein